MIVTVTRQLTKKHGLMKVKVRALKKTVRKTISTFPRVQLA